ncbi:MAG TPA: TOBE domain-containing protein [Zoogloea sp.]|uniref:TOBE domain-containing protein n=1 Tax=Zoogloea sp. TaxID=49181 RepID=UPI002BC37410|nr:TOBE domain-containing protein [Zoogloea sp.]HMZ76043.1 TOBE domain-containing protein [Rhodocyclaceae bacterium]HNC80508.1 TOBE domain-containing protein [Rhodocyclaceae bacterium]HNH16644.1 TOBE domain-containing protein [Zoogloea sp.]HNI49224.1 TOBE domain-containing protein [Zoogloea sp.]
MTTRRPIHHKLVGTLTVDTEFGTFLGDTRIRLLEAIERYGSISQAAKAVPLSYKAAWDAVDAMNNLAEEPLVERSVGGKHGGGTSLTEYGQRVIALYRAVELEYQQAIDRLAKTLGEPGAGSVRQFQTLLRRMSMRTSARNQFVGTVSGLREGEVSFEVRVRLDDAHEIVAVITRESAENLELAIGLEVHAFVKAPSVIIVTDPETRTSARNHLWGEVTRIHPGPVSSEVTITLPSGRNVTSVVTHDSIDMLALAPGVPACAVFQASAVILAVFD